MPTIQQLRDKRANVWSQMQEIRTAVDTDGWTAELREKWDRADAELLELGADIEREDANAKLEKRFGDIDNDTVVVDADGNPTSRDAYATAFGKFIRAGRHGLEADEIRMLQANFDPELRAQGVGSGAAGGYTVPQGFWAKVTETLKFFGGVLQANPETHDTDTGNDIPWPTNDDTSNTGALLSENTQITGQDLSFGQKTLHAYTYTSKLILASIQFLQDTGIDAEAFIAKKIGQRLGRIYNTHWTTGDAASKPQGFITGATTGKTTASATAITYAEIVDLLHSVDVAYRTFGAVFAMHDLVLAYVRKLTDSQNRPLWQPSIAEGFPDTLLGYPVVVNNDMDSTVATTKKTMAFGSFGLGYVVRRVAGGQLMRLEERYADYLQVGFFGFGRVDGLVQDSSAFKLLVQA